MKEDWHKFRAETYRVFGLALLTPIGHIVLSPLSFYINYGNNFSLAYFALALSLAFIGFASIGKANVIMKNRGA